MPHRVPPLEGLPVLRADVVPIPGSKNQERILENLGAWNVGLSDDEFTTLDNALNQIPVQGYRGFEEFDGGTMADWGKKK